MKRRAAITGPTPAFVRWAIAQPCALRPVVEERFVDQTFRHLRSIRELSTAIDEGRVVDGFALHPNWESVAVDNVDGFGVEEVAQPFGGVSKVESSCEHCPANVRSENSLAGCYGFLATNGVSLDRILSGYAVSADEDDHDDLQRCLFEAAQTEGLFERVADCFGIHEFALNSKSRLWHALWRPSTQRINVHSFERVFTADQLGVMVDLFSGLLDAPSIDCSDSLRRSVVNFVSGMKQALMHRVSFRAELVCSGFSENGIWRLDPSCPICRFVPTRWVSDRHASSLDPSTTIRGDCAACGATVSWAAGPSFKVLGNRPYLNLTSVVGSETVKRLVSMMKTRRTLQD